MKSEFYSQHLTESGRYHVSLIVMMCLFLTGCQYLEPKPLKPWDRDILAQPAMQPDSGSMEELLDEKIYFSKEASRGGASIGGGGCGCN